MMKYFETYGANANMYSMKGVCNCGAGLWEKELCL